MKPTLVTPDNSKTFAEAVQAAQAKEVVNRLSLIMFVEGEDGQASHILMVRNEDPKTGETYFDLPTTKRGIGTDSIIGLSAAISKKYGITRKFIKEQTSVPVETIPPLQGRYDPQSMAHFAIVPTPVLFLDPVSGYRSMNNIHYKDIEAFEDIFAGEAGQNGQIIAMPFEDAFKLLTQERGVPLEAFAGIIEHPQIQHKLGLISDASFKKACDRIQRLNQNFAAAQAENGASESSGNSKNAFWDGVKSTANVLVCMLT